MKFNVGNLGIEVLLSWAEGEKPPVVKPPEPVVQPPIATQPALPKLDKNREAVYKLTSAFEGGPKGKINYTNLTWNFDSITGYSIGFLQWTVGTGSEIGLQQMMLEKYPNAMKKAFGTYFDEFIHYMKADIKTRLGWAIKSVNDGNRIDPNWAIVLRAECLSPEFQSIQNIFAEKIYQRALSMCKEYGVKTLRAVALFFDIITQGGSIRSSTKTEILNVKIAKERALGRILKEREYLEIIADKRSRASNARWVQDVLARKMCIVQGNGRVHGDVYDINKDFGIDDSIVI